LTSNGTLLENGAANGIRLVLGGGGARGLAHLGVFKVLERNGLPLQFITANSAGGIAAAAYLQRGSAERAEQEILQFLSSPPFARLKLSSSLERKMGAEGPFSLLGRVLSGWRRQVAMQLLFSRPSLFNNRRLEMVIEALVEDGNLEDLSVPLYVIALDLCSGDQVELEKGSVRKAVLASSAVPGFFPPVAWNGSLLIDAGQANNLPVPSARARPGGPLVAVNLSGRPEQRQSFTSGIEIMLRAEELGTLYANQLRAQIADVVIEPDLCGRHWLDFSDVSSIIQAGEEAALKAVPRIEELLILTSRGTPRAPVA